MGDDQDLIDPVLDRLRALEPLRVDPWRWLLIEALARRMVGQSEAVRRRLEVVLRDAVAAHHQALAAGEHRLEQKRRDSTIGPLRELRDALQNFGEGEGQVAEQPASRAPDCGDSGHGFDELATDAYELRALRRFRPIWARLSAEQQLRRTMNHVPPQAGPLNSPHLLHRALRLMQDSAPAYLQHFVAHVDALLWLERLQAQTAEPAARATERANGRAKARAGTARRPASSQRSGRRIG